MEALLCIIFSLIISIPTSIWSGFVLTKLWMWFIVPVFALAPLTIVPAIGLALVVSFLTFHLPYEKSKPDYSGLLAHQLSVGFIRPLFALFFGYIVHLFM